MQRIRDLRGGRENVSEFGARMRGQGIWGELIRQRFRKTCVRLGLGHASQSIPALDTTRFIPPTGNSAQGQLF